MKYIVFEGLDGCGKTTQIERLKTYFEKLGQKVCLVREPGMSEAGKVLREIVKTNASISTKTRELLFQADRAETIDKFISPAIARGEVVISDRSLITGLGYASQETVQDLLVLNKYSTCGIVPNVVIIPLIDKETFTTRVLSRDGKMDVIESRIAENLISTQDNLISASKLICEDNHIILVDGKNNEDQVFEDIIASLTKIDLDKVKVNGV